MSRGRVGPHPGGCARDGRHPHGNGLPESCPDLAHRGLLRRRRSPLISVIARTRRAADARQAALADFGQQSFGYMTALTRVKAHRHEAMAAARLGRTAGHLGAVSVTAAHLRSLMGPLVGLGQQVAMMAVAVVATQGVIAGDLSSAASNAFFLLLLYLTSPVTVVVLGIGHLRGLCRPITDTSGFWDRTSGRTDVPAGRCRRAARDVCPPASRCDAGGGRGHPPPLDTPPRSEFRCHHGSRPGRCGLTGFASDRQRRRLRRG